MIRFLRICTVLTLAALALNGASYAEEAPAPQYVNTAPLPGAGVALNSNGEPDGCGAMQVNIPVAYTPGSGYTNVSAYAGQFVNQDKSKPEWNNGTGTIGLGFGDWPRFYGSAMAVSSIVFHDSKVVSGQLQFVRETDSSPAVAVGVQDLQDKESADFSATHHTGIGYYAVATKGISLLGRDAYVTAGYGKGRFRDRPFGGISLPLNGHVSLATEYDGFQMNTALGIRPHGRYSKLTVLAGYNGEAGWLVGANTVGKANPLWAIPLTLLLIRH